MHLEMMNASYLKNEEGEMPVIMIERQTRNNDRVLIIGLTNQTIRIWCPTCYTLLQNYSHTDPTHGEVGNLANPAGTDN